MDQHAEFHKIPNEMIYDGMIFNSSFFKPEIISRYSEIDTTKLDVIVATFPKSGTTWVFEIIHLLRAKDKETASKSMIKRSIFLDLFLNNEDPVSLVISRFGEERIMKTHLPARYLAKQIDDGKAKVIVVMRNPKDVLVSFFHYYRLNNYFGNFAGSWDEFFDLFKHKGLAFGDWLDFNKSYWLYRGKSNVIFLTYEDMKMDVKKCILQLASFLGIPCTEEDADLIAKLADFNNMKGNEAVNGKNRAWFDKKGDLIRKGKKGSWKELFTVEQSEYVDSLYENEIKRLGLPIIYS